MEFEDDAISLGIELYHVRGKKSDVRSLKSEADLPEVADDPVLPKSQYTTADVTSPSVKDRLTRCTDRLSD